MNSSFREYTEMLRTLSPDLEHCLDHFGEEDNQFWRRTYIRALFALAECSVFRMKQVALDIHNLEGDVFDEAELAFLKEEDGSEYSLNQKGEARKLEKKRFIPFENNVKFAFKMFARAFNSNYSLSLGDGGWDALRDALKIRHRLTHPKFISQLDISDQELQGIIKGGFWLQKAVLDIWASGSISE